MLKMRVVSLLVVAALTLEIDAAQYSPYYCAICKDHTECIYPPGLSSACGRNQPYSYGVSEADKRTIIKAHNDYRGRIAGGQETRGSNGGQPSASNMRRMEWDDELAKIAQKWVDQCNYAHDKCRNVRDAADPTRQNVEQIGQNVALTMADEKYHNRHGSAANWTDACAGWYDEVDLFNQEDRTHFQMQEATGHFTQLVWADSYRVGCGFIYFKAPKPLNPNKPYQALFACNYGPSGNWPGQTMYETGELCSDCPGAGVTSKFCYNNLCSKTDQSD